MTFGLDFNLFLLHENKVYLGQRIGDILSAIQDLDQNKGGMGARQLVANSDRIVGQIRKILHGTWSKKEEKWLKQLQKAGVALAKAIDEKDDLEAILATVSTEIQDVMTKMKVPINSLGSQEDESDKSKSDDNEAQLADTQSKENPKPPQPKQNQQPPSQNDAQQPETAATGAPQNPQPQFQQPPNS